MRYLLLIADWLHFNSIFPSPSKQEFPFCARSLPKSLALLPGRVNRKPRLTILRWHRGSFGPFCGDAVLSSPVPVCLAANVSPLDDFRALVCFLSWVVNRPAATTPRSFSACCRTASDSDVLQPARANNCAQGSPADRPSLPSIVLSTVPKPYPFVISRVTSSEKQIPRNCWKH